MKNLNNKNFFNHKPCSFFEQGICQSCTMMGEPIAIGQISKLDKKLSILIEKFPEVDLLPFFGLSDYQGSRQKAKLAYFEDEFTQSMELGIYNLKEKISLINCPLYTKHMQKVLLGTRDFLKQAKIIPYDIVKRKGEGKFVIVTESLPYVGEKNNTFMVRLVLRSKEGLDRLKKQSIDFLKNYPEVKLLSVNLQPLAKATLEGDEEILISNNNVFINGFQNQKLNLTVQSFSQVNSIVAFNLYNYVKELLRANHIQNVLDLYCGVGGFSLNASDVLDSVWGIELSSEAIKMAQLSAKQLSKKNFLYEAGDVEELIKQKKKEELPEAVIVNPPRAGLSVGTSKIICESGIEHVIYSSCNPETFLRDTLILTNEYRLISIKPFDMFMMTDHFELVGHFIRNKS